MSPGIQWFEYIMVLLIHSIGFPHNLDSCLHCTIGCLNDSLAKSLTPSVPKLHHPRKGRARISGSPAIIFCMFGGQKYGIGQ